MFKVGQKVVFVSPHEGGDIFGNNPEHNSICEILAVLSNNFIPHGPKGKYYELVGYEYNKLRRRQCFHQSELRPIDFSFGEKLAEEIQTEINEEQLVNA